MWKNILYSGNNFNYNDKLLKYKFKLMNTILLLAIFSSFFIAFLFIFIGTKEAKTLVIILELSYGFTNLALFFFLRHNKNNLNVVTHLGMISLYISQVVVMIFVIDDSYRQAWFFLTIMISFFLLGKKFGYIMLFMVFVTMLIYNFQPFIQTNQNKIEAYISIVLLLLVGFVMHLYETTKENYESSLKKVNKSLENKIEEINQFNITLETRVQEEFEKNKQNEHRLSTQAKMVAMGEMLGNIAHQWRQPLSVISTTATGSKMQKEMDLLTNTMFYKNMNIINDNAQYLSKTIDTFRNFAKGERIKKSFNLSHEIDDFLHLVQGNIKVYHINVIMNLDENINISGYPNELIQCFINIFNNSKDAIKESENINKLIFISTYLENDKVVITIKDNAGGIDEKVLPKIFIPYFTTKHQSLGTGIGLNMTYKLIVEGMKGSIEANNVKYTYKEKEYQGAEFKIILPLI